MRQRATEQWHRYQTAALWSQELAIPLEVLRVRLHGVPFRTGWTSDGSTVPTYAEVHVREASAGLLGEAVRRSA